MNFHYISKCRICEKNNFIKYLNLGNQPASNSFLKKITEKENKYPLEVLLCKNCGLSQLSVVVSSKDIFSDYDYLSSNSKQLVLHYKKLVEKLVSKFKLTSNDLILDIGCNDGVLLNNYPLNINQIYGYEPSNAYKHIKNKNISVINKFFSKKNAELFIKKNTSPRIITITNVFAHIDNIRNFTQGLSTISNEQTIIIIEFPYLIDMIRKTYFDVIYHEHLSYLSLTPLIKLFKMFNLEIWDAEKLTIGASGPALRIFVSKKNNHNIKTKRLKKFIKYEKEWGINKIRNYKNFSTEVSQIKKQFIKIISSIRKKNKKIGCFTAPAKGNTLLNYLNVSNKTIKYVAENNVKKINKFTPGTKYKIISDKDFNNKKIDYAILLSWNYKNFFIKNSKFFLKGGKFIIPFPRPKVIKND